MKSKVIIAVLLIAFIAGLTGCSENNDVVYVYNWGDFIDMDNLKAFTEETGIKVIYDTYPSNEDLYSKIKQGGTNYDVIVPSEYMVERMIKEDLLEKLDHSKIPSYSTIDDSFKKLESDPGNQYSIPYLWGTVGIIYNSKEIQNEITSWSDLWNPEYAGEIMMYNSQRDAIMVALKKNGFSMNTRDKNELEIAKNDLIAQKPLVYAYLGDEGRDEMIAGSANIFFAYSGDALMMIKENKDLRYVLPKEGTNLWFDNWAIPKGAKNIENAYKFIDFMTRPENAYRNAEYNFGYSLPSTEARQYLSEEYKNNPISYPPQSEIDKMEVFHDVIDVIDIYDSIWTELSVSE